MEQWYTVHTKPHAEYQVAATFRQRGLTAFLPEVRRKCGDQTGPQPFFPCYLFVKVDLDVVGLSAVQWTPGLRRLVAFSDRPVALPEEIIDLIRHRAEALGPTGGLPGLNFKPGDTVRITAGPFKEMLAIFDGPCPAAERVQVLLHLLGQASRYQISVSDLAKAPNQPPANSPGQPDRPRRSRGKGRLIHAH